MNRSCTGVLLATALLAFASCDDSTSSDTPSPPPPGLSAAQVSMLDSLFAPATAAETTLIASQWKARGVQVEDIRTEESFRASIALSPLYRGLLPEATATDTLPMKVISHVVDGFRHNGIMYVPEGTGPFPVLVFAHGDDEGIDALQWNLLLQAIGSLRDSIAVVAPSFRSEAVNVTAGFWVSEGRPSPWDRDVDDLRGLLRACARTDTRLDTARVSLVGYSRGGGVALLAAQRDPVFRSVATIAAPTSFQGPWVRGLAESLLEGEGISLPGVDYIDSAVLRALDKRRISMDSARRELIRRSASTWVRRLPTDLQLHHGYADVTVPPDELVRLQTALQAIGRSPDARFWPNRNHFTVLTAALPEVRAFLSRSLLH